MLPAKMLLLCAALALPLGSARAAIDADAPTPNRIAQSYKLPISPPLDQGDSDLCWIYATLSMLETNYLETHPGSHIRLSRGALQRASILDRFQRAITGNSTHLEDGGLAVDALRLIRQQGLVAQSDFHDIVDSDPLFASLPRRLAAFPDADARLKALDAALGPSPRLGRLDGRALTSADFAKAVLGDKVWTEYDIAPAGAPRAGLSDDPDARPETMVHFIDRAAAIKLIHDSLARGEAVVWGSTDNHALLIYGGDYDGDGRPLAYWVKDSFAPYTRRVDAEEVHKILTDVTVAAPSQALTAQGK